MHLIELRSGREGHPAYRAVAQAMHERIAAIHPAVAAAMTHVDTSQEPRLERILSEIRTHRKRVGAGGRRREPARAQPPRLSLSRAACASSAELALAGSSVVWLWASSRAGRRQAGVLPSAISAAAFSPGVGQGSASPDCQAGGRPPGTQPRSSRPR